MNRTVKVNIEIENGYIPSIADTLYFSTIPEAESFVEDFNSRNNKITSKGYKYAYLVKEEDLI